VISKQVLNPAMRTALLPLYVLLLSLSFAEATAAYDEAIASAEAAVGVANTITGLGAFYEQRKAPVPISAVEKVVYQDSTTPFLHDSLSGLPAWQVTYGDFNLVIDETGAKSSDPCASKTLQVWVDSASGLLLRCEIVSLLAPIPVYPSPNQVERIKAMAHNRYVGVPRTPPSVSMVDALQKWHKFCLGASPISVQYLTVTYQSDDPFDAWCLVFTGWEKGSMNPVSVSVIDVWVNAQTGEVSPLRYDSFTPPIDTSGSEPIR